MRKTKAMVVSRKKVPPKPTVMLNGLPVELVSSFRYLGILLSFDLSWSLHILSACVKAKRLIGFIYRSFFLSSQHCLSYLYKTLVRPILEYCSVVWDPYHLKYSKMLERVQNFAGRVSTRDWTATPEDIRQKLGWPLLSVRRTYLKLALCRRILTGGSLIPSSVFSPHTYSMVRHTNSCPLLLPFVRTEYHHGFFFVNVVPTWNALPESIVSIVSDQVFKKYLKLYLVV